MKFLKVKRNLSILALSFYGVTAGAFDKTQIREFTSFKTAGKFECLLGGDFYYGDVYQEHYKKIYEPYLDLSKDAGYDAPLDNFEDILGQSDLNIVNLATPLTNQKFSPLAGLTEKEFLHKGSLDKTPQALKRHQIHVVSLANNHALDFGTVGLTQTIGHLNNIGIQTFGAGDNLKEAYQPYLFQFKLESGKLFRVAIIGALDDRDSYHKGKFDFYAREDKAGVAILDKDVNDPLVQTRLERLVKSLRKFDKNMLIILFPHWGKNYQKVSPRQLSLAENLKAMGIDVIIGHGSHTAHPISSDKSHLTAFNIGNFVFNTKGGYERSRTIAYSFLVKMIKPLENDKVIFKFYPIYTNNKTENYSPRFVGPGEFPEVLKYIGIQDSSKVTKGRDKTSWYLKYEISHPVE